jgi:membrane fusion protein (multidrug efflux system)
MSSKLRGTAAPLGISHAWLLASGMALVMAQSGCTPTPTAAAKAVARDAHRADFEFATREAVRPLRISFARVVEFSGPLVAPDTVVVRARAPGTLRSLAVREGQRVRAGETLGALDVADLRSHAAERRANLEAVKTVLAQAQRTFDANLRLADERFISTAAVDASRDLYASAKAQVAAAEAALESARLSVSDAQLAAPIDGIVLRRDVVVGEKVTAEQALLTIVDPRTIELAGAVSAQQAGSLAPGMSVELRVDGRAAPMRGTLARIAPAGQPGTRSIGVAVRLDNADGTLRAGEYADARVQVDDPAPVLAIPCSAIISASGQEYAWTIEQHRLRRRAITTGRRDASSGLVEVVDGLQPDVDVLAMRFDSLRDGATASIAVPTVAR